MSEYEGKYSPEYHKNADVEVVNPVHTEIVNHQIHIVDNSQPAQTSIGRIVHYVLNGGPHNGEHRPAIIVKTSENAVNLQIFADRDDNPGCEDKTFWATSVPYADATENKPFSYHWPERV
jgi:hypothetical protein